MSKHVALFNEITDHLSNAFNYAMWAACDNPSTPISNYGIKTDNFDSRNLRQKLVREAVDILSIMRVTPGVGTDVRIQNEDLRAIFMFHKDLRLTYRDPLIRYCLKVIREVSRSVDGCSVPICAATLGVSGSTRSQSRSQHPILKFEIRGSAGAYLWSTQMQNHHVKPDEKLISDLYYYLVSADVLPHRDGQNWEDLINHPVAFSALTAITERLLKEFGCNKSAEEATVEEVPGWYHLDFQALLREVYHKGVPVLDQDLTEHPEGGTFTLEDFDVLPVGGIATSLVTSRLKGLRMMNTLLHHNRGINVLQGGSEGSLSDLSSVFQEMDTIVQFVKFIPDAPRVLEKISRGILRRVLENMNVEELPSPDEHVSDEQVRTTDPEAVTPVASETVPDLVEVAPAVIPPPLVEITNPAPEVERPAAEPIAEDEEGEPLDLLIG